MCTYGPVLRTHQKRRASEHSLALSSTQWLFVCATDPWETRRSRCAVHSPSTCLLWTGCGPVREDYAKECSRAHLFKQEMRKRLELKPWVESSCLLSFWNERVLYYVQREKVAGKKILLAIITGYFTRIILTIPLSFLVLNTTPQTKAASEGQNFQGVSKNIYCTWWCIVCLTTSCVSNQMGTTF